MDESLALGVLGEHGRGACEHCGLRAGDAEIVSASIGACLCHPSIRILHGMYTAETVQLCKDVCPGTSGSGDREQNTTLPGRACCLIVSLLVVHLEVLGGASVLAKLVRGCMGRAVSAILKCCRGQNV